MFSNTSSGKSYVWTMISSSFLLIACAQINLIILDNWSILFSYFRLLRARNTLEQIWMFLPSRSDSLANNAMTIPSFSSFGFSSKSFIWIATGIYFASSAGKKSSGLVQARKIKWTFLFIPFSKNCNKYELISSVIFSKWDRINTIDSFCFSLIYDFIFSTRNGSGLERSRWTIFAPFWRIPFFTWEFLQTSSASVCFPQPSFP